MQPLDVTCFKPFKQAFRTYKDKWTFAHKGQKPLKEDLTQWISCGLRRAFSTENIVNGFASTGIFSLNATAMDSKMGPSEAYERIEAENNHGKNSSAWQNRSDLEQWKLEEIFEENVEDISSCTHYYVNIDGDGEKQIGVAMNTTSRVEANQAMKMEDRSKGNELHIHHEATEMQQGDTSSLQHPEGSKNRFSKFLELPKVALLATS